VEYYEIEFSKEGTTVEVANNETLLDAGEEEGWDLPYACREGSCLSCSGHIAEGPAEEYIRHSNNDTLNEDEMEKGYCLTCTAYPTTDFTLETSESP
jgi:2Fe-2S type ferredoxin